MNFLLISVGFLSVTAGLPFPQEFLSPPTQTSPTVYREIPENNRGFRVQQIIPEGTKVVIQVPSETSRQSFRINQIDQQSQQPVQVIQYQGVPHRIQHAPQGVPEHMPHLFLPAQQVTQAIEQIPQGIHHSVQRGQQEVLSQDNFVQQDVSQQATVPVTNGQQLISEQQPVDVQLISQDQNIEQDSQEIYQPTQNSQPAQAVQKTVQNVPQELIVQQGNYASYQKISQDGEQFQQEPRVQQVPQDTLKPPQIVQQQLAEIQHPAVVMVQHGPNGVHIIRQGEYNGQHQHFVQLNGQQGASIQFQKEQKTENTVSVQQSPQRVQEIHETPQHESQGVQIIQEEYIQQQQRVQQEQIQQQGVHQEQVPQQQVQLEKVQQQRVQQQQIQQQGAHQEQAPQQQVQLEKVQQQRVQQQQIQQQQIQQQPIQQQAIQQQEIQQQPFRQQQIQQQPILPQPIQQQPIQQQPIQQQPIQQQQFRQQTIHQQQIQHMAIQQQPIPQQQIQQEPFRQQQIQQQQIPQQPIQQQPIQQEPFRSQQIQQQIQQQAIKQQPIQQQIQQQPIQQHPAHVQAAEPVRQSVPRISEQQSVNPVVVQRGAQVIRQGEQIEKLETNGQSGQRTDNVPTITQEQQAVVTVQHGPSGVQEEQNRVQPNVQSSQISLNEENAIPKSQQATQISNEATPAPTQAVYQDGGVATAPAQGHKIPQVQISHEGENGQSVRKTIASVSQNIGIQIQGSSAGPVLTPVKQIPHISHFSFGVPTSTNQDSQKREEVQKQASDIQNLPPVLQTVGQSVVVEVPQVSQTIKEVSHGVQAIHPAVHQVSQGVHQFNQGVQQAFQGVQQASPVSEGLQQVYQGIRNSAEGYVNSNLRDKQPVQPAQIFHQTVQEVSQREAPLENRQIPFQQDDIPHQKQFHLFQSQGQRGQPTGHQEVSQQDGILENRQLPFQQEDISHENRFHPLQSQVQRGKPTGHQEVPQDDVLEIRQLPFQNEDIPHNKQFHPFQSQVQRGQLAGQPARPQYGNRKPVQSATVNQIYDNTPQRVESTAADEADPTPVPIIRYENSVSPDGTYQWSYESGNGIKAQESGLLLNRGDPEKEALAVTGGYSYTGPDGILYSVEYVADQYGFHPSARHIPTQPPIPEALQKAIDDHMAILATAEPDPEEESVQTDKLSAPQTKYRIS